MSLSVAFDKFHEIVHVVYSGRVTMGERMQTVQDVCDTYRNIMPLKIIVNVCDLEMDLSFEEQSAFGSYLAGYEGLANARVAVLHPLGKNPNLIVDTIAFENGYLLAQFDDIEEAESWLTKI